MATDPTPVAMVTRADVEAAREVLTNVSRLTPVEGSRPLSELVGGTVLLKCENLQRAGSFKIRGGYVRISRLTDEERARGVVAASAGKPAPGGAAPGPPLGARAPPLLPPGAPPPQGGGGQGAGPPGAVYGVAPGG